jgi:hypothetical protein
VAEFSLYLDDGGHPNDQPALVVAGYVATDRQWQKFEPEWKSTLAKFNLGDAFHMTEFMGRRYSPLKRDQILSALRRVIAAYTIRPFVGGIDMAAYRRVNEEFTLEECYGAPYALVARGLAKAFREWASEALGPEDRWRVFVEQGTKHYGDLEQVFKRDRIQLPTRVLKATAQVQPADILAWETFKQVGFGDTEEFSRNLHRLTRAARQQREIRGLFKEVDLRRLCVDTGAPLRSTMGPRDSIAFHSDRKRKRKRTIA